MPARHDDPATDADLVAEFAATAEDILTRLAQSKEVAAELAAEGFSATAWRAAVEAGWPEALLTESAGGLGLSLREVGPIFVAAGRHLFAGPLAEHAVAGPLAASACDGPAADRLRVVLGGEGLLAVVDPAADVPDAPLPLLADSRLDGSSEVVRFAARAAELLVVADGPGGPAVVLVPAARTGVATSARESLDPTTELAKVAFDGVEVAAEDTIAGGDRARELIARTRAGMRVATACELSGIADRALALAVDYAKEREQFGRPIGSFQALQHILAEMAREAFGLSRLCREAAAADLADLEDAALVAKAHAATAARSVVESSLQAHGGIAFTVEHELYRYYTHLLFLDGFYGERHELHTLLGRRLLTGAGDPWPAWS